MTYKELLTTLMSMDENQLSTDVMVFETYKEEGQEYCRKITGDIHLHYAKDGAMSNGESVTDDYYGISDEKIENNPIKPLLCCNQPYLMMGSGFIPTCRS